MSYLSTFAHRAEPLDEPKPHRRLFTVDLDLCVFTLQDISPRHLFAPPDDAETGPIVVSRLSDGGYFVHNGRHRVIRARLAGDTRLLAESLYEGDGTEPE